MILESLSKHVLFSTLEKTQHGSIQLKIENPSADYTFGTGQLVAEIFVRDFNILNEIVRGGDIELASAIIREDIVISDEAAFIFWACKNDELLKSSFHGKFIGTLLPRIKRWVKPNTVRGAKKNIMAHYDLGNEFYSQWLDSTMSYSSAIFSSVSRDDFLPDAQLRKYDRMIDKLGINSNDHVLEIGCGWGGFFSRVVERTGCKVTAVMNSPSQAQFNQELIHRKGLQSNVNLELKDYRQIQGKFDKIVSIEMIEAVGEKFWPIYFGKISASLKAGGRAMLQSITIREDLFKEYRQNPDFINTMIFPGGMLLSNKSIQMQAEHAGLQSDPEIFEFGQCYAETLRRWRRHFVAAYDNGQLPTIDRRFANLWRFYMSYCEGAFKAQRINVGQFELARSK